MALSEKAAANKDKTSGLGDLQHRHFATISTIIREIPSTIKGLDGKPLHSFTCEDVAVHFADRLTHTNPRFDRSRFLAACGVEEVSA